VTCAADGAVAAAVFTGLGVGVGVGVFVADGFEDEPEEDAPETVDPGAEPEAVDPEEDDPDPETPDEAVPVAESSSVSTAVFFGVGVGVGGTGTSGDGDATTATSVIGAGDGATEGATSASRPVSGDVAPPADAHTAATIPAITRRPTIVATRRERERMRSGRSLLTREPPLPDDGAESPRGTTRSTADHSGTAPWDEKRPPGDPPADVRNPPRMLSPFQVHSEDRSFGRPGRFHPDHGPLGQDLASMGSAGRQPGLEYRVSRRRL